MELYVATKFGARARAQRFIDDAIEAGHYITWDWTRAAENAIDDDLTIAQCAFHARRDLRGVHDAELIVFLADDPEFCGALIEFGYGVALGRRAWVVNPWRKSIFWYTEHVSIIDDEHTARGLLGMKSLNGC